MKSFTILLSGLFFLLLSNTAEAQTKFLFLEHFSNTKCPNCQSSRSSIYSNLAKYEGEVNHITIHRKFPYPDCPLYLYNKEEADQRDEVYDNSVARISGTPDLVVAGNHGSHHNLDRRIDDGKSNDVVIGLNMVETGTNVRKAALEVRNLSSTEMSNLFVYAALVEKEVNITVDGDAYEIHDVFRKFLGNDGGKGTAVNTLAPGGVEKITLQGIVPNDLSSSNVYVVAWVEERRPDSGKYRIIPHNSVSIKTNTITSVDKLALTEEEFSIYPNPVRTDIRIKNTSDFNPKHIRLFDVSGKELKRMTVQRSISVEELSAGTYYLIFDDGKNQVSRKFVKQ